MKTAKKEVEDNEPIAHVHMDFYTGSHLFQGLLQSPIQTRIDISLNHLVHHKAYFQTQKEQTITLLQDSHTILRMKDNPLTWAQQTPANNG